MSYSRLQAAKDLPEPFLCQLITHVFLPLFSMNPVVGHRPAAHAADPYRGQYSIRYRQMSVVPATDGRIGPGGGFMVY